MVGVVHFYSHDVGSSKLDYLGSVFVLHIKKRKILILGGFMATRVFNMKNMTSLINLHAQSYYVGKKLETNFEGVCQSPCLRWKTSECMFKVP